MYQFPHGLEELEGIANRTDFDIGSHTKNQKDFDIKAKVKQNSDSVIKLAVQDKINNTWTIPYVIEPSAGADRAALAFLCEAYTEDEAPDDGGEMKSRTVMRLHPRLAPIKAAVFPLVKKDGMPEVARDIYRALKPHFNVFYDEKGAVGRRYRRQDEAGTPYCLTIDGQTKEDGTVTIRDRDTMEQERIPSEKVVATVREKLSLS